MRRTATNISGQVKAWLGLISLDLNKPCPIITRSKNNKFTDRERQPKNPVNSDFRTIKKLTTEKPGEKGP